MSVETVVAVLTADSGVTALVSTRVSPMVMPQGIEMPAVTYQRVSVTPQNNLRNNGDLDYTRVQLDSWAQSSSSARAVAAACRAAMETAGHAMLGEFDNYDPQTDPGLYRITQDFQVWE